MKLNTYKAEQEAFVSNLNGSNAGKILLCIFHIHMFVFILKLVQRSNAPSAFRDIILIVIPTIVIATVSSQYNHFSLLSIHVVALAVLLLNPYVQNNSNEQDYNNSYTVPNTYYLTLFKGML